ncbi:MAG: RNA methyltransferase [Deltaproteobacteria bacterium]|nr:RNA methyltransferase [Deltaproteobacteria bacterium]
MRVDVALVHYPVYNKNQEIIGSAVTNLDIHDIARAGRTFGIDTFYIVTPYQDQRKMVGEIVGHWQDGYGSRYNTDRKEALASVVICDDLAALYALTTVNNQKPLVVATSARVHDRLIRYGALREKIFQGNHVLLLFGTAWGLAEEAMAGIDVMLPPISGFGDYRHLSVRSAVSVVLDRLLGNREE